MYRCSRSQFDANNARSAQNDSLQPAFVFNLTRYDHSAVRDFAMSSDRNSARSIYGFVRGIGKRLPAERDDRPACLPATSNEALPRRRHYIYPREDSGVYMPTGPAEVTGKSSSSTPHPQAQLNPFEDARYEYGATISETQPSPAPLGGPRCITSNPSAVTTIAESKGRRGYRRRLRDRIRAMFRREVIACGYRPSSDRAPLLGGEGTHLRRGTVRGQ